MKIRVDVYHHFGNSENELILQTILNKLNKIEMNQDELKSALDTMSAQVQKIGTESAASLTKIQELQDALNNSGTVSEAVQTAVDNLKAQLQIVDDLVPDAKEG